MPGTETLRSYGFGTSLREMSGPNRTFESPESNLPLPGISYFQVLNPKVEMCQISPEYTAANKRIANGMIIVGGLFTADGLVGAPHMAALGIGFAGLGALHYWAFWDTERKQQAAQLTPQG